MSDKKPDGYYALKLEVETLKKNIKELKQIINAYAKQDKYLMRQIKRLSGELIQLQHEVNDIHANGRRK